MAPMDVECLSYTSSSGLTVLILLSLLSLWGILMNGGAVYIFTRFHLVKKKSNIVLLILLLSQLFLVLLLCPWKVIQILRSEVSGWVSLFSEKRLKNFHHSVSFLCMLPD